MDLEVRELEQFSAVAEELHFGRAAQRLRIAQPALSKTVRRIESRLGVTLLERSSRQVRLTPAGAALLLHGRVALDAVAAATRAARRAGEEDSHLRLVMKPGGDAGLLSSILTRYAEQPGARRVDVLFSGGTDRTDHLRDGRADVGLLFAPFDDLDGLDHETLCVEDRVVVLPASHPLAHHAEVTLGDLDGETFPRWRGVPGGNGPAIADVPQMAHMIALGRTIAMLPRSLVDPAPAGLVRVPVTDAPPSRLVIAWPEHDRRPLLASFITAARDAATTARPTQSSTDSRAPEGHVGPTTPGP